MKLPTVLLKSAVALAVILAIGARESRADAVVSLVIPAGIDFYNLSVGQELTFSLVISGLPAGQSIFSAGVGVDFFNVIGTAQTFTLVDSAPGSIVTDPAGFEVQSYNFPSSTDDQFDVSVSTGSPITDNGTLATFTVAAAAPGLGAIDIGGTSYGTDGYPLSSDNTSTGFQIVGAAVPEPSALMLGGTAALAGLAGSRLRRGRRAVSRRS